MSKAPIEILLDKVEWKTVDNDSYDEAMGSADYIPYATYEGVCSFFGETLRCYRLSDGTTVFHSEDVERLLGVIGFDK